MKNRPRLGNLLLVLELALGLVAAGCTSDKHHAAAEPVQKTGENSLRISGEAMANVKLTEVHPVDFPETLNLMGKISPTEDRTAVVPARVSGRIDAVQVASGEFVQKGQILASLFSPDFVAAKEEYLQSLKSAQDAGSGNSDFRGFSALSRKRLETMGLAPSDIEALGKAPAGTPGAGSDTAGSPHLVVRAPRAGAIVTKNATVGNLVNVGDSLFTIADLGKVWFLGDLYPEDLPKVKKNQEIMIAGLPGVPPIYGKVSFISPVVDPTVRSIKLRALMDNPHLAIRSDMYVQGSLILSRAEALVVPTSALLRDQNQTYLFKRVSAPTAEGAAAGVTVTKLAVKAGSEQAGNTAIVSGLQAGDAVISEGALLLDAALNDSGT